MKAKNLCTYAGLCAGFASMAVAGGDKPELQLANGLKKVDPVQVAKIRYESGKIVFVSDWMDYNPSNTRAPNDERVFDCFGDSNADGVPDGGQACGLTNDGSRWYFGSGYCNGMFTNDMTLHPDTNLSAGLGRLDLSWYWGCLGLPVEECIIAVFTQESNPANGCELNSFDYSGWALNYGTLTCSAGWYSNVDLFDSNGGTWPAPTTGTGSYVMQYLTSGGAALATCAQPFLWGIQGNNPGSQETEQFDDDAPVDGTHTISECYTYSYGLCPDPLGGMGQFWGELDAGDPCDYADFDNNNVVDTRDFTAFLNKWVPKDSSADCDQNGVVDTRDFTCFLNLWVPCRP